MEPKVQNHRDLRVWQLSMNLVEECYRLSAKFPKEEIYGLTTQLRRAAISVPANIAEGFGRESRATYQNFLRISQGSLKELETHLILSVRLGMAQPDQVDEALNSCDNIGRMLRGLIRSLDRESK
jgi:four helix bundle protein